jgi:hypothetical protein
VVEGIRQHLKVEGGQPAAMLGCFRGLAPQVPLLAELPV